MKTMLDRRLYTGMKLLSALFNPFMAPFLSFMVLFFFTYLNLLLPWSYQLLVLCVVLAFTILIPSFCIFVLRKANGWGIGAFHIRERRYTPYLIYIINYVACLLLMNELLLPRYMNGIILGSLLSMIFSILANFEWKISEHMTAMGGVVGGLIIFSALFNYNPLGWLSFFLLLAGALGSSRINLKHHTITEVIMGFGIGFICIFLGIGLFFYDLF